MKWPIGFNTELHKEKDGISTLPDETPSIAPRRSVVQIHFPVRGMTLSYYNDRFDLHIGDTVFVDGKLEGLRGHVVDVTYNFKIKLSDYKRVIAVADTHVTGEFFLAGSHFLSFDENAIPFRKVLTWFIPPQKPEDEYAVGFDGRSFDLDHLEEMGVSESVADRGLNYYRENKVVYISLESGGRGIAIVEGSEPYIVEFCCRNGMISDLTCSCFCSYPCKHQFAAMLQLRETFEHMLQHYRNYYEISGYFAAVSKPVFMHYAMSGKKTGCFRL